MPPTHRLVSLIVAMALLTLGPIFLTSIPAQAQGVVILVGNLGQNSAAADLTLNSGAGRIAQAFTTGNDPGGYDLSAVVLDLDVEQTDRVRVEIYSDQRGGPGYPLYVLNEPVTRATGQNTFSAPTGVLLLPGTTYHVVISYRNGSFGVRSTNSTAEDTGQLRGWSMANLAVSYHPVKQSWEGVSTGAIVKMEVMGFQTWRPATPLGLSARTFSGTRILLSWSEPDTGGRAPVAGYIIEGSKDGGYPWIVDVANTGTTGTSHVVSGLKPGTTRHFRIRAFNGTHSSHPSASASATTTDLGQTPLTILASNFEFPNDPLNADQISSYDLNSSLTSVAQGIGVPQSAGVLILSSVAIDLQDYGSRDDLSLSIHEDNDGLPGYRLLQLDNPSDLSVEKPSFSAEGGLLLDTGRTFHIVVSREQGSFKVGAVFKQGFNSTSSPGWSTGSQHGYTSASSDWVLLRSTDNKGALTVEIEGYIFSDGSPKPNRPEAIALDANRIRLTWENPTNSGPSTITGHRIEYSVNGQDSWAPLEERVDLPVTWYTHTGLSAGETVHYRISAMDSIGSSQASDSVAATTFRSDSALSNHSQRDALAFTLSERVFQAEQAFITGVGDGLYILSAVAVDFGHVQLGERVTVSVHADVLGDPGAMLFQLKPSGNLVNGKNWFYAPGTVSLQPGLPHHVVLTRHANSSFSIATTDLDGGKATGTGNWTFAGVSSHFDEIRDTWIDMESNQRFLKLEVIGGVAPALSAPVNPAAEPTAYREITVSWDPPPRQPSLPITRYRLETLAEDGENWTPLARDLLYTKTTYVHTGVDPGTTHHYRIIAVNAAGTSSPSEIATATATALPTPPLVGNLGQTPDVGEGTAIEYCNSPVAQPFTTGPVGTGYYLDSMVVDLLHSGVDPIGVRVKIFTNSLNEPPDVPFDEYVGTPGLELLDLGVRSTSRSGNVRYSAPAGTRLDHSTVYHVTVERREFEESEEPRFLRWGKSVGIATDTNGADGWSIAPVPIHFDLCQDEKWVHDQFAGNLRLAVYGAPYLPSSLPVKLVAVRPSETSIDLTWEAPETRSDRITGYRIEWSPDGNGSWTELEADTGSQDTFYRDTGLEPGETRHYRVSSDSPAGQSEPSAPAFPSAMVLTTLVSNTGQPTTDGGSVLTSYFLKGFWQGFTTGKNPGGYLLSSVTVTVETTHQATDLEMGVFTEPSIGVGTLLHRMIRTETIVNGENIFRAPFGATLKPSTTYYFGTTYSISSEDPTLFYRPELTTSKQEDAGHAPGWRIEDVIRTQTVEDYLGRSGSYVIQLEVKGLELEPPGAPLNLAATASGKSRIDLSWTAPETDNALPVTGYQVDWALGPEGPWLLLEASTGPVTRFSDVDLPTGVTRYYRVRTITGASISEPSNVAHAMTRAPGPALVSNVAQPDSSDRIALDGTTLRQASQAFTTGTHPGGYLMESVIIHLDEVDSFNDLEVQLYPTGDRGFPAFPLGSLALFEGAGVPVDGENTFGARGHVNLDPSTTYHVVVSRKSEEFKLVPTDESAEDEHGRDNWSIANLKFTTTHESSSSQNTGSLQVAVLGWPQIVPQTPTDLVAVAAEESRIDLTWTDAVGEGGPPVTGYRVEKSSDNSSWQVLVDDTASAQPWYSDTSLDPWTVRYYRVIALNATGESHPSEAAVAISSINTGRVLVSNFGQESRGTRSVNDLRAMAQAFTTGPHEYGYALGAVALEMGSEIRPGNEIVVELYKDVSGFESTLVHRLSGPSLLIGGRQKFVAPAEAELEPSTVYHIRVGRNRPFTRHLVADTESDKEDEGHEEGWSIADGSMHVDTPGLGILERFSGSLKFEITGEPGVESPDATLRNITVTPDDIHAFDPDRREYEVGVASSVNRATLAITPKDADSTWATDPGDRDSTSPGVQVNLRSGANPIEITVTSQNRQNREVYTVNVNRGVTASFGWKAADDLDGIHSAGTTAVHGIWSDGTRFLGTDREQSKLFAYHVNGARASLYDRDLGEDNGNPGDIWSDGEIIWVADVVAGKLFAYALNTGISVPTRDITLVSGNNAPAGLWSDGTTIWVGNVGGGRIFAYSLSDGARRSQRDIRLRGHVNANAVVSDGVLMWAADKGKLYAYNLAGGGRVPAKDFNTLRGTGNSSPSGAWTNGKTLWVSDSSTNKVYSYNMPVASNADLRALAVDGVDISDFDPSNTGEYPVVVANEVLQVTVSAEVSQQEARITSIVPTDADLVKDGHQVDLILNGPPIVVTVTAQDGSVKAYHLRVINPTMTTEPVIDNTPDGQVNENAPAGQDIVTVSASDPDSIPLIFTLDAASAAVFDIAANADGVTAVIRTKAMLDHERKPNYLVEVTVTDPYGAATTATLGISVVDVEEPGSLLLRPSPPSLGSGLEANLRDPDDGISIATWQWYRSDTDTGPWTPIQNATSALYVPVEDDIGKFLRATVVYSDTFGSGKTLDGVVLDPVRRTVDQSCGRENAGILSVGTPVKSYISAGDCDWYRLDLEAGKIYRLDMMGASTDHGTLREPLMTGLFAAFEKTVNSDSQTEFVYLPDGMTDEPGESIRTHWQFWNGAYHNGRSYYNDDGGLGFNSRMFFQVYPNELLGSPQGWPAGVHYVRAVSQRENKAGSYTMLLTEVIDDDVNGRDLVLGSWSYGAIDYRGDRDVFEVELTAGKSYVFESTGPQINTVRDTTQYGKGYNNFANQASQSVRIE